ncbi:MAG TPA: hypothetical protein VNE16_02450 [Vicinamibacterales bacterium]|nr:hypothetical protein [Vicinamibacterales bacterium]
MIVKAVVVDPVVVGVEVALPDIATMLAVPDWVPARNVTVALPFFVCAVAPGANEPSVVVNVTVVPSCTACPADEITTAVTCVEPLIGSTETGALTLIVELVGASSGTFRHPVTRPIPAVRRRRRSVPGSR